MNPLVSIIVPVYNSEKYLVECLDSIQNQTYRNLQIILVNDGSTDKSLDICISFANTDSRFEIINQMNNGVSSARNRGIEAAVGEYIGFVDSDDYLNFEMFEKLIRTIIANEADICVLLNHTIKPVSSKILSSTSLSNCEALRELFLLKFPSSLWAYIYKREVIKKVRLNSQIHFFEDFEFNYRILNDVKKVALSVDDLYYYRVHDMSTNKQSINSKRLTCLDIFDLHKESIINSECNLDVFSNCFRSHFLISVMVSIAKSIDVDKDFHKFAKLKLKDMFIDVMLSKYVSVYYKLAIIVYSINPYLFKVIMNLRR